MFNGLGLFFDTYANGRQKGHFPYITAMIGDGKTKYDPSTDNKSNEVGGCTAFFREREHVTRAKVVYVEDKMLQVFVDVDGLGSWKNCFTKNDVSLPKRGYFGFTSETGDASDNHDILRVSTYSIQNEHTGKGTPQPPVVQNDAVKQRPLRQMGTADAKPAAPQPPQPPSDSSSSAWGWMWTALVVVFCVIAVGAVAAGALVAYQKMNQPKSYKRF
ncbi:hypothetical protein HDU83_003773 [Entophlyctis luteolus]|nr:hypothetical protein HDU83_003773 [Entophlyctis luteolus]KAJ3377376.1 hypothetical protein HDU84_008720 [Entophlyctis sp. JEL0112]